MQGTLTEIIIILSFVFISLYLSTPIKAQGKSKEMS
jgi:hypothetical protein